MKIYVYTNHDCPKCRITLLAMKAKGLRPVKRDLKNYPALIEKCRAKGLQAMPVVVVSYHDGTRTMWNDFNIDKINRLAELNN